jgi:diaminopimelate epimerase
MRFTKLHGLGNDFLVVSPAERAGIASPGALARRICDRHTGVGADGLILLDPRPGGGEPLRARFRIFNSDGSEAEISGNGLRCAAAFLVASGTLPSPRILFETAAGDRPAEVLGARGRLYEVRIGLGEPRLASKEIPFHEGRPRDRVIDQPISANFNTYTVTCVSMGNPHCAIFFDRLPPRVEWHRIGAEVESHPSFPHRTNVEFVHVLGRNDIEVLFWERGVGETMASGTGSAAAAVAAVLKGLVDRSVTVHTAIGDLKVDWPEGGGILQTGPAEVVFAGDFPVD